MTAARALALVVLLAALGSARAAAEDADSPYLDRDLCVAVAPAAGWTLHVGTEAKAWSPDAHIVLEFGGWYRVELEVLGAKGSTLDQLAWRYLPRANDRLAVDAIERTTWTGFPARACSWKGGADTRYGIGRTMVLLRGDVGIVVSAFAPPAASDRVSPRQIASWLRMVSLLPGTPRLPPDEERDVSLRLTGMRIHEGTLIDPLQGWELDLPLGWTWDAATMRRQQATLVPAVARHRATDVTLRIGSTAASVELIAMKMLVDDPLGDTAWTELEGESARIADVEGEWWTSTSTGPRGWSQVILRLPWRGRVLWVDVVGSAAGMEAAADDLESVLANLRWQTGPRRQQLLADMRRSPPRDHVRGESWSVHGGVFRDLDAGCAWTAPTRSWEVVPPSPSSSRPAAFLDWSRGAHGAVELLHAGSSWLPLDGFSDTSWGTERSPRGEPTWCLVNGWLGRRSSELVHVLDATLRHDTVVVLTPAGVVRLTVVGPADGGGAVDVPFREALAGLLIGPSVDGVTTKERLVDVLDGVHVHRPGGEGWRLWRGPPLDPPQSWLATSFARLAFVRGDDQVGWTTRPVPSGGDPRPGPLVTYLLSEWGFETPKRLVVGEDCGWPVAFVETSPGRPLYLWFVLRDRLLHVVVSTLPPASDRPVTNLPAWFELLD